MCGIVGVVSNKQIDAPWLGKALEQLGHRGPDASGLWVSDDARFYLGHRRLAILDLSVLGNQPMHFNEASLSIVFNGEIYNFQEIRDQLISEGHTFKSMTDTEVILHAYAHFGIDFLNKLNGMFAFCLIDQRNQKVFLCRDRAGEKPLFYSYNQGVLSFASELKGLIENPQIDRSIDFTSIDSLFAYGFIPGELCIYKNIKKLPPAHILTYDLKNESIKLERFWELPMLNSNLYEEKSDEEIKQGLSDLLFDSVKKQLIADVPVGVLLSGGIDSSLVTAYASKAKSNINTFTVAFKGNRKFDESHHARLISSFFKTQHTEIEGSSLTPDLLYTLAWQFDEPMIDSSVLPTYMVTNLIKKYCTVAIGGDGGDELFGGYHHYSRLLWMAKKAESIPNIFRNGVSIAAKHFLPIGFKGRVWLQNLGANYDKELPLIATLFEEQFREQLMTESNRWELVAEYNRSLRIPKNTSLLQRATRMDFYNYMPEDILVKVDRASMLNSLELRAPFLDYRVIEYAFSTIPDRLKANENDRKIILKNIARDLLPREFDFHRKQGFGVPLGTWIRSGVWNEFVADILHNESGFFNKKAVDKLFKSHMKGNENTERIFSLVMFELWRKAYKISL